MQHCIASTSLCIVFVLGFGMYLAVAVGLLHWVTFFGNWVSIGFKGK